MKRQSSFETAPSKVRAASSPSQGQAVAVTPPSQQELLPSPGSSRQMVPVQQSMGRGKPVFYRLDYLFGKTPDKQASPGLSGQQARQREEQAAEERRQEAEEEARAALARHGMDKAVTEKRKQGRPPGAKTNWKTVPGLRKKRAEVSAAGKLSLVQELKKMETATGSKAAAKQHLRRQYKVSHSFASRLAKPSEQERLADFVHMRSLGKSGLRQQGSHLGFAWMQWRGLGKRMSKTPGATLGKTDRHRQVWTQTALWAQLQGHQLSMEDVLDDFEERLYKAVSVRQTQADKGLASPEKLKELAAWKQKQDSLANKPKQRAKFKVRLMSRCGLRQRSSQQAQQLTAEDEKARLQVAWRLWDARGSSQPHPSKTDLPVSDVEAWVMDRKNTWITMSDQVPVWLKPAAGKMVTSLVRLRASKEQQTQRRERRKARQEGRKAAVPQRDLGRGSGMPSAAQDRRQDGESASYADSMCGDTLTQPSSRKEECQAAFWSCMAATADSKISPRQGHGSRQSGLW